MPADERPTVLLLEDFAYRKNQEEKLVERVAASGFDVLIHKPDSGLPDFGVSEFSGKKAPAALIRWEENGGLYGSMHRYRELAKLCYKIGIAPIAVDFAFFDHYKGFTFDLLGGGGRSGIDRDWRSLPTTIDFDSIPGDVGAHIRSIRSVYQEEREKAPAHGKYSVVAFLQAELRRCSLPMSDYSITEWVKSLYEIFGDRIIFKSAPSPTLREVNFPDGARSLGRLNFPQTENLVRFNANLAVHADFVITNSSGVTNEFLVADLPVVTTGTSFFSGKDVFTEIEDWGELSNPEGWIPRLNRAARAKYIHWFLGHQCLHRQDSNILKDLVAEFHERRRPKSLIHRLFAS